MNTTTDLHHVLTASTDTSWMTTERACFGEDPELFFPLGEGRAFTEQIREAKQVCAGCPLRQQCLQFGMTQSDGIFGGLTAEERRTMREAAGRPAGRSEEDSEELFPALEYGYSTDEARQLFRELVDELQRAGKATIHPRDVPPAFYANVRSRAWVYDMLQKLADAGVLVRTTLPGAYVFRSYSTASAIAS
ncbi:WhiB family transcriptional regulator [Amycolatopsis sp. NBC_01286]|uniref:WhiB family transcriptional regulator n=1 Tax=Amycolatopsis sp. NBC_01286 TaxID=2903560 RepID=UPI003FA3A798